MSRASILAEALQLPAEERAKLITELIDALDDEGNDDPALVEQAWTVELEARVTRADAHREPASQATGSMKATVVRTNPGTAMCEARTSNDLLIVFQLPQNGELRIGDVLEIANLELDADIVIVNATRGTTFKVYLAANDVHDLRLAMTHGGSRTPPRVRLNSE